MEEHFFGHLSSDTDTHKFAVMMDKRFADTVVARIVDPVPNRM